MDAFLFFVVLCYAVGFFLNLFFLFQYRYHWIHRPITVYCCMAKGHNKLNKKIRFSVRLKSWNRSPKSLFTIINQVNDKTIWYCCFFFLAGALLLNSACFRNEVNAISKQVRSSMGFYFSFMLIIKNFSFLRHSIKCIIRNVVCIMHAKIDNVKTFYIFHVHGKSLCSHSVRSVCYFCRWVSRILSLSLARLV